MLELELAYENGDNSRAAYAIPLLIGRDPACGLRLRSWRVARNHARIAPRGGILFLEDLGSIGGTYVNGRRVSQHGPVSPGDEIIIGPCRIQVLRASPTDQPALTAASRAAVFESDQARLRNSVDPASAENHADGILSGDPVHASAVRKCAAAVQSKGGASMPETDRHAPESSPSNGCACLPEATSSEAASSEATSPEASLAEPKSPASKSPESKSPESKSPESKFPESKFPESKSSGSTSPGSTSHEAASCEAASCEAASHEAASHEAASHEAASCEAASRGAPFSAASGRPLAQPDALHVHHRRRLHKLLLEALDLRRRDILALSDEALRGEATEVLSGIIKHDGQLPPDIDHADILRQVVDEAVGLGPLEPLLADRSVTEIMVNFHEEIYVERAGRLARHDGGFSSEQAVVAIIDRIVAPLGRRVDEASPMVDARLHDGSRVNAVIPPIALRGACLTIRKFPERRLDMEDLLNVGSLDSHMAAFLAACVQRRKSMLVSGGTGSGKTTLLNVLSNCIPAGERIITIEDAAELKLNHEHLIALEARPANAEGKGRVEIRDLVRNALRMRPDRIIVGECRGAEAFDMLSAMNTGHEGSLTTLHANSPRDALARLETMILMAGMDLPLAAIREHVASAVDLIVQQARLSDGRRLVTAIVEVTGMEAGRIQTQELFRYCSDGEPRFEGCGVQPECFQRDDDPFPLDGLNQTTVLPGGARQWQSLS